MPIRSITTIGASSVAPTGLMPCRLIQIGVYSRGATAQWVHIFDAQQLPSNGAVPIKVFPIGITSYIERGFQTQPLVMAAGCVVALSTTEATLTISADLCDFNVDLEEWELPKVATTAVAVQAAISSKQFWNEAAGPKKLITVAFTNGVVGRRWLQVHAVDSPASGSAIPVISYPLQTEKNDAGNNYTGKSTGLITFGEGLIVAQDDASGVRRKGCGIFISSTPSVYTDPGETNYSIGGTYA